MSTFRAKKEDLGHFLETILNSYSQIFFSTYKPFAIAILLATFFDFHTGLAGLLSVVVTAVTAYILNLDKATTAKGLYGFNSLLVGLGLGVYFSFSPELFFILILASILTLFISISFQGIIGKYYLPYLSLPFILSMWIFVLGTRSFEALGISERGVYMLNELYQIGGNRLIKIHDFFQNIELPDVVTTYFISLSAILFQFSVLTGIILSLGLLLYSRIGFSLSVIGFGVAYLFYQLIGANITEIDYSYIGFNYILTAMALGGFFLVPSARSYIWTVLLIPLVAIITISLNTIFIEFKLAVYSLPFNMVVMLFIYILKFRTEYSYKLSEVYYQYNSPEKNLYIFLNNADRFRYRYFRQLKLPFFGVWSVSQGHNGEHTHKSEWRYAWDFVILDKDAKQFKNEGDFPEDYYCFNKPVIAPDDGIVEKVVDNIEDNTIGQVNLENNWGNTIIIKHADTLYTKLSHLKKSSVKVKEGEQVKSGQIIASCGNSGRSPYPHLHFQVQENPYIGSVTMEYPISAYIHIKDNEFNFHSHQKPRQDELISNIEANELLSRAFHFTPGQKLHFCVKEPIAREVSWEVKVNPYNETYLYCKESGAIAYFEQGENQFYFTYFEGSRKCMLYYFFLAAYKIQEGFYKNLVLKDNYPLSLTFPKGIRWFHDFISPFIRIIKSEYRIQYREIDDYMSPSKITLSSSARNVFLKKELNRTDFELLVTGGGIEKLTIKEEEQIILLERCEKS